MECDTWIEDELFSVDTGDVRLNKRLASVASDMLNSPGSAIQSASGSWPKAKAAYRLFDNHKLNERAMLSAHQVETQKRLAESSSDVFLAIQDTTKLNYTHHPKKRGMGKLHKSPGFTEPVKGCLLHNTLLTSEKGLPLGLLDQKIYQHVSSKVSNKNRPIHEKESYRWLESLQKTKELARDKTVVTVCDRESDIFEFFVEANKLNAAILLRAAHNRILFAKKNHHAHVNLWPYLEKQSISGTINLTLPAKPKRKERQVTLSVRYAKISITPPTRNPSARCSELEAVELTAIYALEEQPPHGEKPLEWMLLTNLEMPNFDKARQMLDWYRQRWQIENFHRVLKSGCNIEDCRLEDYTRLKKVIVLKSIIAFKLLWLTHINRHDGSSSCSVILQKHEWQVLLSATNKKMTLTEKPPTVSEAITMIAKLGGYLARKNDGPPGMTYIWRGWEKLQNFSELWSCMQNGTTYG